MDSYIALSYWDLAAASALVFINAGLSVIFRLRLHRSLLIAAIRMVVQLALVGVVLTTLFSVVSPLWTGLTALGMVLFAGHEAAQRQERRLWAGGPTARYWLHDGVIGGGDGLCPPNRAAAKSLVRPALCNTASGHDFRQLPEPGLRSVSTP